MNTLRGNWGYAAEKTSDYVFGSAALFERDDFGPEVMFGFMPSPTTPEASNEVFDRTAEDAARRVQLRASGGRQDLRRHRNAARRPEAGPGAAEGAGQESRRPGRGPGAL